MNNNLLLASLTALSILSAAPVVTAETHFMMDVVKMENATAKNKHKSKSKSKSKNDKQSNQLLLEKQLWLGNFNGGITTHCKIYKNRVVIEKDLSFGVDRIPDVIPNYRITEEKPLFLDDSILGIIAITESLPETIEVMDTLPCGYGTHSQTYGYLNDEPFVLREDPGCGSDLITREHHPSAILLMDLIARHCN